MLEKISTFLSRQSHSVQQSHVISLYRKGLNLYVLVITCLQLGSAQDLWSEQALLPIKFYEGNIFFQSLNMLSHAAIAPYYWIFVSVLLICCMLSFFVKRQRILSLLIYFCSANLIHRTQVIQNGSSDLLLIQLFFLLLMDENANEGNEGKWKSFNITLSNYALLASQLQLIMVYVISVIFKLQGTHWIEGTALHYVLLNPDFSLPTFQKLTPEIPNILWLCSWIVFLFQMAFPVLVWIKKTKIPLLILGIIIHLMIVFVMGIIDFGLIMVVMYLLFASEDWSKKQLSNLKLKRS